MNALNADSKASLGTSWKGRATGLAFRKTGEPSEVRPKNPEAIAVLRIRVSAQKQWVNQNSHNHNAVLSLYTQGENGM